MYTKYRRLQTSLNSMYTNYSRNVGENIEIEYQEGNKNKHITAFLL